LFNGVAYLRKFFSSVKGNKIRIYNAYNPSDVLVEYIDFSQISLNGQEYGSVFTLQEALLDVIFVTSSDSAGLPDALISGFDGNNVSITNGVLKINAGAVWRINGQIFTNTVDFFVTINPASNGMYRTDLIQANQNGTFEKKVGVEGSTIGQKPATDSGKLEVTSVNVFGAQIGSPEIPIEGGNYITKYSKNITSVNLFSNNMLVLQPRSRFEITTNPALIYGFVDIGSAVLQYYDGAEITISFLNANTETVLHNLYATAGYKFHFPLLNQNYVARPNETLTFVLNLALKILRLKSSSLDVPTIQRQVIINGNTTLNNLHNNCVLLVKNDALVSIPSGLMKGFNCVFRTYDATLIVEIVPSSGVVLDAPTGSILEAKKMSTLMQELSTGFYFYHGETTTT